MRVEPTISPPLSFPNLQMQIIKGMNHVKSTYHSNQFIIVLIIQ